MNLTKENIEEYIARFMEGETTNEEEQAIYRFFRSEEVPAHLKEYIPMFAWYEEGMPEIPETSPEQPAKSAKRFHLPVEVWSIGAAAMIAIIVGLGTLLYWDKGDELPAEWACYEGSYIEVGGKRISNVRQIMPSILETLNQADRIERLAQERIDEIRRSEEAIRKKEMLVNH